ncbi:Uncharacterised protein [[Clostridium] sordellii]|uniref:DUF1643 domain-containing protein n=1 Tax=Paraclostridium sordellii TaxID=1505 RepID=UPI0005DDC05E|nr:DUF1643 domain-containing protein [Paeniclostridium sordellii]CEP88594.1 Uncharacterised protein [[Clostridium] sordellii] [Paeniclostridium sordellii]
MTKYNSSNYESKFEVKGNFYNFKMPDNSTFGCRNFLQIKRKKIGNKGQRATFIMMNPGSSELIDKNKEDNIPTYDFNYVKENEIPLNLECTKPDNVQFYVMEIMDSVGWDTVNIVNLSDLREASSKQFKLDMDEFKSKLSDYPYIHSIFDNNRLGTSSIIDNKYPIICAWGTGNHRQLDQKAVKYFKSNSIDPIGKKKGGKSSKKYYYLKPRYGKSIVNDLVKIINNI